MNLGHLLGVGLVSALLYAGLHRLQHVIAFRELALWPVALYVAATVITFVLYVRVVTAAAAGRLRGAKVRALALLIPTIISVAFIPARPSLSIDLLSYLGHGYQVRVGGNPYAEPVKDLVETPFGEALAREGWIPVHQLSPYGPLWTWFEGAVGTWGGNLDTQIVILKSTVVLFSLLCGLLIWKILGRVCPADQLTGTLIYLWNPVILMEFAAEGHNDSIVIAAALSALLLATRLRAGGSVLVMGLGALVKITVLALAPPQLIFCWRMRQRKAAFAVLGAAAVIAVLAVLLYAPLWIGLGTLDGLRAHGRPNLHPSTQGVLFSYLARSHSEVASALAVTLALTGGFVLYVLFTSLKAVDAQSMMRACGRIALVYLVVAPGYWPWYATLPVAFMALAPRGVFVWAIVTISLASRFAAPIDRLRLNGLMEWPTEVVVLTAVGVWAPAFLLLFIAASRERLISRAATLLATAVGLPRGNGK